MHQAYLFLSLTFYMTSLFMVSTFNSYLLFWLGLELNMISFLILMFTESYKEEMLYYFTIQSVSSLGFLFFFMLEDSYLNSMLLMVLLKMGFIPFHFWVLSICNSLKEHLFVLLLSFQKFPGMVFLVSSTNHMIMVILFMNMLMGSIYMLFSVGLVKILVFSSFFNLAFIYFLGLLSMEFMLFYLLFYFMFIYFSFIFKSSLILIIISLFFCSFPIFFSFILKVYFVSLFQNFGLIFFAIVSSSAFISFFSYLKVFFQMSYYSIFEFAFLSPYRTQSFGFFFMFGALPILSLILLF